MPHSNRASIAVSPPPPRSAPERANPSAAVAANETSIGGFRGAARVLSHLLIWVGLTLVVVGLSRSSLYVSGKGLGYAMGLVGGILMLVLLLYPLRKRASWAAPLGRLRYWFAAHMVLGIGGPVLVLLHSRLHLGSLNASVAFWCMVVVAGSGIVGRFLYARLHRGLYGRQQTLAEVRAEATALRVQVEQGLTGLPDVAGVLGDFAKDAETADAGPLRVFKLPLLSLRGYIAVWRCKKLLRAAHLAVSVESALFASCRREMVAIIRAAQFRAVERLFALWHVLHLPLVFILVITAVVHVIAVHMY